MMNKFLRVIGFLLIGIVLFQILQYIFIPKNLSYSSNVAKLTGFYNEKEDTLDVIIAGTSHSAYSIIPMELYEEYGIKSYNLSTDAQPIEVAYYVLCESLKTQNPSVFILDMSSIYFKEHTEPVWRSVLDDMHFGENKLAFAKEYCKQFQNVDEDRSIYEVLFPLLGYHTRWKDLTQQDFMYFDCNKHDYGKGEFVLSVITECGISVEAMNSTEMDLLQETERLEYKYSGGVFRELHREDVLYSVDIPEENLEWFFKIKDVCDENNIQLLAIKVPSINFPQKYRSAWTNEKHNKIQELCDEYEISYYDLLYDANVEIDWTRESIDGGEHLNLNGSQKVTSIIGEYLKNHYTLSDGYDKQWDKDLLLYQKKRKVMKLELEQDFDIYINTLANEYKDKMIFITVSDDIASGMNEKHANVLKGLGLQADFSDAYGYSYIAVIDSGNVIYETLSNRQLVYEGICPKSGKTYAMTSSGWFTNPKASIEIEEIEYAFNSRGFNIVVYDDERNLILDSVCFDIVIEGQPALRDNSLIWRLKENFNKYIVEVEDR